MTLMARQDASGYGGAAITFTQATASDTIVGGQNVHMLLLTATTMEIPVPSRYNDSTGVATVTFSAPAPVATITRAAVQGTSQA